MAGKVLDYHPCVPEGIYTVAYDGYETAQSWNNKKVNVRFSIVDGDYAGIPLMRFYNARHLSDPIGPEGDFEVGDRCHLVREFRSLLPDVRSISEIDLNRYRDKRIRVRVETVNKSGLGDELSASNQYSVIRRLLEILPETYESE